VIDPALQIDGTIAAIERNIAGSSAAEMIDAAGKLVTPGLIDIHMHVRSKDIARFCLSRGVTSLVDGGSQGADTIDEVITLAKARTFPAFEGLGTLRVGATADVAIMELREGDFEFVDNENAKRKGRLKLMPSTTIIGGKRAAGSAE
jgi:predicted amidohydrolase